jgi:purine-binding chemotaxis protein CheW
MTENNKEQLCTFFLGELYFGIEVTRVQEVLRYQETTRVPRAPAVVHGLLNLRGQIVTALDLRARLGLAERSNGKLPMNVVVRRAGGAVSLLVDEIGEVVEVERRDFERAPETLTGAARELIRGAYKLDRRLLLLMDVEKVAA